MRGEFRDHFLVGEGRLQTTFVPFLNLESAEDHKEKGTEAVDQEHHPKDQLPFVNALWKQGCLIPVFGGPRIESRLLRD